jgi:hypothetical protein
MATFRQQKLKGLQTDSAALEEQGAAVFGSAALVEAFVTGVAKSDHRFALTFQNELDVSTPKPPPSGPRGPSTLE